MAGVLHITPTIVHIIMEDMVILILIMRILDLLITTVQECLAVVECVVKITQAQPQTVAHVLHKMHVAMPIPDGQLVLQQH